MTKHIEKAVRALRSLEGYLHLMSASQKVLADVHFDT